MQKRIIINSSAIETRVALCEANALAELHVESGEEHSIVGNIYKGKVLRVLPGMQAAFVEIGLDKAAFMHVSDFWRAPGGDGADGAPGEAAELDLEPSLAAYAEEADGDAPALAEPSPPTCEENCIPAVPAATIATPDSADSGEETGPASDEEAPGEPAEGDGTDDGDGKPRAPRTRDETPMPSIEEVLSKGQEILVQVSKEPIGSKGARITSHISLPGRYVVYMPTTDHIGVSRRIEDDKERQRLRDIVATGRPKDAGGFIVRTACEGVSKREIVADMRFLARLWTSIVKKSNATAAPALLHADLDIVLRAVRDLFTSDVKQVVVDRPDDHRRVIEFVDSVLQPKLKSRVELYEGIEPIFDHFGIENQVNRALERRVWLKSGGYLVFDQTEALTTIDVNTGRFVGKKTHEDTVLKTNLEAARVVIDQLRLRNIGGIIIIDFIDMEKAANRKKVSEALAEAVKRDKARTNILRISELGLVQMTRKRTRDNLRQLVTTPCSTCGGDGRLKSVGALAAEVLRLVRRQVATANDVERIVLTVSPEVATALQGPLRAGVDELTARLGVRITVRTDAKLPRDRSELQITSSPSSKHAHEPEPPVLVAASSGPAVGDS
ncbi:Rne/Rng family ribonuclease [Candidatus Binatia bacterium]|nr:Rne/Rng family ribonuclease [Candidatus Binatia bacterium]